MDQVDFEPAQHWSATILQANEHHSHSDSQTRCVAYLLFQSFNNWYALLNFCNKFFALHFFFLAAWGGYVIFFFLIILTYFITFYFLIIDHRLI